MTTPKAVRDFLSAIGRKGGKRSRVRLTPAQRRRLARKAVRARWAKAKRKKRT